MAYRSHSRSCSSVTLHKQMTRHATILGMLIWLLPGFCNVQAAQAVYTLSSVGSGFLGSHQFSSTPFTITSTADTSQIRNPSLGFFQVPDITATVFVSGIGTATFTIPTA